ncbi:MAG: 4Fe-4S dicluster domain-containing protein [Methanomassiliicoccales archaeon]
MSDIRVYIMGREHRVPQGLTIMKAMEFAGYRLVRGCGCRAGFCGACATIFRKEGEYRLNTALACQTEAEDGMYLTQLPFVPATKSRYDIEELDAGPNALIAQYPEVMRCVACNTCTKACPQDIQVMDFIQAVKRGDVARAAELSFNCLQCGLCAARCPAEIKHYHVAQLARRLYGRYLSPRSRPLEERIGELDEGGYREEVEELASLDPEELKERYYGREIKVSE